MSVAADVEGFLILGFALLKESFIAGEHIKSLVDIEGYIVSLTHPSSVLNTKSRTKYQSLGLTLLNARSSCIFSYIRGWGIQMQCNKYYILFKV